MAYWTARVILWLIAVCYSVFAFGHAMNIAGMAGFDWRNAPLAWQLIDVLYIAADLAVVYGFVLLRPIGFMAFFIAALSQLALFWALPGEGVGGGAQRSAYLAIFIPFHIATIALVLVAIVLLRKRPSAGST